MSQEKSQFNGKVQIKKASPRITPGRKLNGLILILGFGLLIYGFVGVLDWWKTTKQVKPPSAQSDVSRPSETPLPLTNDPPFKYSVHDPMIIDFPTIKTAGYIQKVSINAKDRSVGVPSNINLAGWYTNSVIPGQAGLSIIDGHVQGKYRPGIFKRLDRLQVGDIFTITFGDHSQKKFKIAASRRFEISQATKALFDHRADISHQLNLITCGGKYDQTTNNYLQRLVVTAKLIS